MEEKKIIGRKPYSSHPDDHYLEVVIAKVQKTEYTHEFVTWVYNKHSNGYAHGHYFGNDFKAALEDFNQRGNP